MKVIKRGKTYHVTGSAAGKRIRQSLATTNLHEARRKAEALTFEEPTFLQASELYLRRMKQDTKRTREITLELQDFFGSLKLSELSSAVVASYVHERFYEEAERTYSPDTIRRYLTQLKAVLNWCAAENMTEGIPRITLPPPVPGRKRFLEVHEIEALLRAAPLSFRPLLKFLLGTGCRVGEALALDWRDVDLKRAQVRFTSRKGGRTKTRSVPLPEAIVHELEGMADRTGRVWRRDNGTAYLNRDGIRHAWDVTVRASGLADVRVHDLRRTYATHLLLEGSDLIAIAELLGHEDLAMLKRSYAHVTSKHLTRTVARLPY